MMYTANFHSLILLLILSYDTRLQVSSQWRQEVQAERHKALYGRSFLNVTETTMERCMGKCLENCRCRSFQMCGDNKCQLCSKHKEWPSSVFREAIGCTHYSLQGDFFEINDQYCDKTSCSAEINCCMTSNPCQNNGKCKPHSRKRFECTCPAGYTGTRCQKRAKSCRDYFNAHEQSSTTKTYALLDKNNNHFEAFCDFDQNSSMAWTLIQSYQLQNKSSFQQSFSEDGPVNGDNPSWKSYRLSKSRMESINRDSTKWRVTCEYDKDGRVNYTDYVRGSKDKIDILKYDDDRCIELEYIDVRGQNCTNCTCRVVQEEGNFPLHFDIVVEHGRQKCVFNPTKDQKLCSDAGNEDNFGYYKCVNPNHRCTASQTSATQTWLGGKIS